MSRWASGCPTEDLLVGFAEGRLVGSKQEKVVEHLSACDVCLSAVAGVGQQVTGSQSSGPATAFRVGDVVAGRYEIRRFVDRGGMGEVYEAGDRLLGGRVAIKTVVLTSSAHPRAIEQIRREVQVARAINHPGVCRVFDLGEHVMDAAEPDAARRFFLTMEFIDGTTLGRRIRTDGRLDMDVLLPLACQLADGLAAAHEVGVVHRDFKSDNVMMVSASAGGVARAVVMDFGLARGGPQSIGFGSTGGGMVGSAAYMAPEQVCGEAIQAAADIYAFGVVLFEASTGVLPFVAPTALATATKRLFDPPPLPHTLVPQMDRGLEQIILRCMQRQPNDRFASMAAVRGELARLEGAIFAAAVTERGERVSMPARTKIRGGWVAVAAGALVLLGLTLGPLRRHFFGRNEAPVPIGARPTVLGGAVDSRSPSAGEPPARNVGPVAAGAPAQAAIAQTPMARTDPAPPTSRGQGAHPASGARTRPKQVVARTPELRTAPANNSLSGNDAAFVGAVAPDRNADSPRSRSPLDGFENPFQ